MNQAQHWNIIRTIRVLVLVAHLVNAAVESIWRNNTTLLYPPCLDAIDDALLKVFKPFRLLRAVETLSPGKDAVMEQTVRVIAYFISTLFLASGLVQVKESWTKTPSGKSVIRNTVYEAIGGRVECWCDNEITSIIQLSNESGIE